MTMLVRILFGIFFLYSADKNLVAFFQRAVVGDGVMLCVGGENGDGDLASCAVSFGSQEVGGIAFELHRRSGYEQMRRGLADGDRNLGRHTRLHDFSRGSVERKCDAEDFGFRHPSGLGRCLGNLFDFAGDHRVRVTVKLDLGFAADGKFRAVYFINQRQDFHLGQVGQPNDGPAAPVHVADLNLTALVPVFVVDHHPVSRRLDSQAFQIAEGPVMLDFQLLPLDDFDLKLGRLFFLFLFDLGQMIFLFGLRFFEGEQRFLIFATSLDFGGNFGFQFRLFISQPELAQFDFQITLQGLVLRLRLHDFVVGGDDAVFGVFDPRQYGAAVELDDFFSGFDDRPFGGQVNNLDLFIGVGINRSRPDRAQIAIEQQRLFDRVTLNLYRR